MRKITFLMAFLATSLLSFGATGWFNDYVKINVNGAGTTAPTGWYWIGTDPSYATVLQGTNFGTVTTLVIEGCDMKYWSDTQDRTGGAFYYKVTNTAGTVDYIAATEVIWDHVFLGGNDYQGTKTTSIDILSSLPNGSYKLQVWAKSWGGSDDYLSNTGANYVATFTKAYAAGAMSGTYKVGETITSNFNSLSGAVTALNSNGLAGNVVLEITSDITEPANIGLGVNTNSFGITIRPDADANRTITFTQLTDNTSPSGHFLIGYPTSGLTAAWSDANTIATSNVTIDGYAVGGSTKRLTLTNTAASHTNARVIVVVGACVNTIIKNCTINNLTTHTGSPFCVGAVVRKGTAIEVGPTDLTIENNVLNALGNNVAMGARITNSGTLTTVKLVRLKFNNNIVTAKRRLLEINYTDGGEIYNNEFTTAPNGAAGTITYGLWTSLGLSGTFNIYNNKFLSATSEETAAQGHRVVSLASSATYNIYNNTFAGMNKTKASTVALNLTYLFYSGVAGKIYNNTFYMPALTDASQTGGYYRAINLSGNTAEIKNNIFISDEATHTNTSFIGSVPTPASDYNLFYLRQPHTGATVVSTYATLADYQSANPTKDTNSKSADVSFVDATNGDLRIASTSYQDANLQASRLPEVMTDMFGASRYPQTYKGAHEAQMFIINDFETPVVNARIMRTFSGIQIELDNEATVEIYTVNGMMIDKTITSGTYSRDLNNGVYIIRINGKATKFIK